MANERVIKDTVITPQLAVGDRQPGETISNDIEIYKSSGGVTVGLITGPSDTATVNFNDGTTDIGQLEFDHLTQEFALMINSNPIITTDASTTTILGNLTVEGTTTTVDSTVVEIADRIFLLNKDELGPGVTLITAGIEVERGPADDNAGWFYNESTNWWGPTGPAGSLEPGVGVTNVLGNVDTIDTTTAGDSLTIAGTGALIIPVGTTAERPVIPINGMIRFNSDVFELEIYDGSTTMWDPLLTTSGASGGFLDTTGDTMTGDLTMDAGTEINFNFLHLNEGDGNVAVAPDIRMDANGLITAGASLHLMFDDDNSGGDSLDIRYGATTTGSSTLVARFNTTELNLQGNTLANIADPAAGDEVGDRDYNDNRYIEVAGDTMTGDLILNADPTIALGAATKQYVDNSGLDDVVDDTSPQLGGDLDVNGNSIVSVSNGNIAITPNGLGRVILDGLNWPSGDGDSGHVLQTNGSGTLSLGALAANTVNTTQIVNDAVTLAKMDAGTTGNLITYNASGNPAAVSTGLAGQVLTSNGAGSAPTFQDSTGGGVRGDELWGYTISATNEETGLGPGLTLIRIPLLNVVTSANGAELYLELGISTGGAYSTIGTGINFLGANGSQSVDAWSAGVATILGSTDSSGVINGVITLVKEDFSGNDEWFLDWKLSLTNSNHINTGSGYISLTEDIDRIRLTLSSGTFSSGAWYGYGG